MKLQETLDKIYPVFGHSSIAAALMGDQEAFDALATSGDTLEVNDDMLAAKIREYEESQRDCGSDAAWWAWEGRIAFLLCLRDLLRAAVLTGPDNLPDLPLPETTGMVMVVYEQMRKFGTDVLMEATRSTKGGVAMDSSLPGAEPPGARREAVFLTSDDIAKYGLPILEIMSEFRDKQGVDGRLLFAVMCFLTGNIAAWERVVIDPDMTVKQALPMFLVGLSEGQKIESEAGGEEGPKPPTH
jgi:hypothetical protein